MAYFIIPKPGTSSWANTAVLRHVRNMIDSALSRLVYACSKSLSTAGPMSVCSHQCAQVRPGAKMLSANIFMLQSLISASCDVQMLCDMIQTAPWALLFIEKDSLDSKRWTASLKGFTRTSVWDFFLYQRQGLLKPWVFCLLSPKNKQTSWASGLKALSWTYLFQYLEIVH